jgi:threonine dehydratase
MASDVVASTITEIQAARERLGDLVLKTPVWQWKSQTLEQQLGKETEVFLKLELFQYAGSFKPRGALTNIFALSEDEIARGVTAVSAGNHAIALGYAAQVVGASAKVVMPKNANPARVAICKSYGTEVVLVDDVHIAFDEVHRIQEEEGRTFVHPFEGQLTALGTATLGLEFCQQVDDLDAIVVAIGGGGLCAGVASAVKQLHPRCEIFGVEPEGAKSMTLSFASGKPEAIERVETIADSCGAPHAAPYSFGLCQQFVDEIALVDDDALCQAMALLFDEMKLAVEPAGAVSTAALLGPLKERLRGKRVGLIVCGSNIDDENFCRYLQRGRH